MMDPRKTDRMRIQTARMLEIYALLKGELEANTGLALTPVARKQLNEAINTIAGNIAQMAEHLAVPTAENSTAAAAPQLDEIVNAVLKWHLDNDPATESVSKKEGE